MPQVLVTDSTFETLDIERGILEPLGCQIESRQCKTPAELLEVVPKADFVMTQFAPVNAMVIGAMTRARVIVRYGIGVDNVDLDAARARGIPVCNVLDYCSDGGRKGDGSILLTPRAHGLKALKKTPGLFSALGSSPTLITLTNDPLPALRVAACLWAVYDRAQAGVMG